MCGKFTCIYPQKFPNVGKYAIHWASGMEGENRFRVKHNREEPLFYTNMIPRCAVQNLAGSYEDHPRMK